MDNVLYGVLPFVMPFKRPAPQPRGQSDPGPSQPPTKLKKTSESPVELNFSVFLVQAKLSAGEVGELLTLAESRRVRVCHSPEDADVVVTAIGMRRRLERHVSWEIAVS